MPLSTKRQIKQCREGLLPNGVYRLIIEHVEEKDGPSGHPYWNFRLRPIVQGQKSGVAVWDKVSLSPEARFRVENLLNAMEIDEEETPEIEPEYLIGKSYWASLSSREYQGKWSNEEKQYLTPEAAENLLQKQAESTGFSADVDFSTERKTPAAAAPARAKSKTKVSELTDEASPF